jgi:hypothetical protein
VYDPGRRRYEVLPETFAELLPLFGRFRTLDRHRELVLQSGWQDDGSGYLDAALHGLLDKGLLRARNEFLENLRTTSVSDEACPPITSLGWTTRDRPEPLRRSLESFIDYALSYGRRLEFRVFDDSPSPQGRQATRSMLSELARSRQVPLAYAGEEEKRSFAQAVERECSQLPAQLLEFALFDPFGMGYLFGANNNALLLGSVGELTVLLNDDTVCSFAGAPEPAKSFALSASADPTQIRFFPDRSALTEAVPFRLEDFLAIHESLLGRSPGAWLHRHSSEGSVDAGEATPSSLPQFERADARVLLTMVGVCGESGTGAARFVLSLGGRNREELTRSEEHYRMAHRSREVWRCVSCPTVSTAPFLMAMHCGLDNRLLLPPRLPVLRNSDGLFAEILRRCWPGGLIGHLPLAAAHHPAVPTSYAEGQGLKLTLRLADLLAILVRRLDCVGEGAAGLASLGTHLAGIASLTAPKFEKLLRETVVEEMSRYVVHLETLLHRYRGEPAYWARDVEALLEEISRLVVQGPEVRPVDVLSVAGEAEALAVFQALVRRFGELLFHWPAVVESARRLRAGGTSLCRPV